MTVGERIKEQRLRNKMTMEMLARMIGVKKATVSRYESGSITVPSAKIKAIADVLDVAPEYLLGWKDWLPGQTNMLTMYGLNDFTDYTANPEQPTPKQRLLSIINEASEDQIDLLLSLAEAVIKNRK